MTLVRVSRIGDNGMKIPASAIRELKNIIESEYGIMVSIEKSEKLGEALVNIYAEIFKPIAKGTHEQ